MFDKSVFEKFTETGTRALGTYAQSFGMYQASNATIEGVWNYGPTYQEVRGSSSVPLVLAAAGNINQQYATGSGTTGTYRGYYNKLYLTGGAGGEAGRFYTEVSSNAPVDTVNGAHITLGFGASAGNITGLGTAGRFTLMVPSRALTGTIGVIQSEMWADGVASTSSGNLSFFRTVIDGNATGADLIAVVANLFSISGPAAMIGDTAMVRTNTTTATHGVRFLLNGVRYDILCSAAHA